MFVLSVTSSKLKKIGIIAVCAAFVTLGAIYYVSLSADKPVANIGSAVMKAANSTQRANFFSQFGWEINEEPVEIKEVIIPEEFDDVYLKYNEIQKSQGLDLEKYKGARVKLWSYEILNYPENENSDTVIHGNILVYEGIVIGGDISSTQLDGFMHGFSDNAPNMAAPN